MDTKELKIREYAELFASSEPVPGGGGVSSVIGALAAAAGEMVCSLTIGKKKYENIEPEIKGTAKRLADARVKLLELADRDAEAFEPLAAAYKDKTKSDAEMDLLYENAANAPLEVMKQVYSILDELKFLVENGSRLAVSDAACGLAYARAAIAGEIVNVKINTRCIKDDEIREEIDNAADALYKTGIEACDYLFDIVLKELSTGRELK